MPGRYNNERSGKIFVTFLIALLILALGVRVVLSLSVPPINTFPKVDDFIQFNLTQEDLKPYSDLIETLSGDGKLRKTFSRGIAYVTDLETASHYLGEDKLTIFTERIGVRNNAISEKIAEVEERILKTANASRLYWYKDKKNTICLVLLGEYSLAQKRWLDYYAQLSSQTIEEFALRENLVATTRLLSELERLKSENRALIEGIGVPVLAQYFYVEGVYLLIETLFWAFIGVLTNLLLNASAYLRPNQETGASQFRPSEIYVSLTKLVYGPVIALLLALVILAGWIDVGSYATAAWSIPLFAFIFGFNSRKTADLLDRLSEKILGQVSKGIDAGPEIVRQRRIAFNRQLLAQKEPKTFEDVKTIATAYSNVMIDEKVTSLEAKR